VIDPASPPCATCTPVTHTYTSSPGTLNVCMQRCNGRRLTAIYYLNEGWQKADGGELRLYPPFANFAAESEGPPLCDIAPLADRLMLFYADYRTPHEVMPAYAPRFAITLWFFDRDEHSRALDAGKKAKDENAEGSARQAHLEAELRKLEEKFGSGVVR